MENFLTEIQSFLLRIEECIDDGDLIQLNGLYPKLLDCFHFLSRIPSNEEAGTQGIDVGPHGFFNWISTLITESSSLLQQNGEDAVDAPVRIPENIRFNQFGRPQKWTPPEDIELLRSNGLSWPKIARLLGVSPSTIHRRKALLNLNGARTYSVISDADLEAVIINIIDEHPNSGYVYLWASLKSRGLFVPFKRVKEHMRRIDPGGIFQRSRQRIHRRPYRVKAAGYMWHIDANEKLVMWRYYIHGCVDGYSRKIIYLALSHNKEADSVTGPFMNAIAEYGMPVRVRGDGGTENVGVERIMLENQENVKNPFIKGRSVHNVRIERTWREVNRVVTDKFKQIFFELEEADVLYETSVLDLLCLSHIYFHRINKSLQNFLLMHSHHTLSSARSFTPDQLWLISTLRRAYSNDLPVRVQQPIPSFQIPVPDFHLEERDALINSDVQRLLSFTEFVELRALYEFKNIAYNIIPDPLYNDNNDGKTLYLELRRHMLNIVE